MIQATSASTGENQSRELTPFELEVWNCRKTVYSVIYKMLGRYSNQHMLAEEITQEVMMKAFRAAATFRQDANLKTWVIAIARHKCIDFIRCNRKHLTHDKMSSLDVLLGYSEAENHLGLIVDHPEDDAIQADYRRTLVGNGLAKLHAKYRVPIVLYFWEELSYEEIAQGCKLPIGTIKSRLNRGKELLRLQLKPGGHMKGKVLAPPMWLAQHKQKPVRSPKVLVVEASYSMLTCRIDANVVFWDRGNVLSHAPIPQDITVIWIGPDVPGALRARLASEAIARQIEVWHCSLLELREKLLPIWADDANRSMIWPAVDQGPDIFREREEKERLGRHRANLERLEALREAGARAEAIRAEAEALRQAQINEALKQFSSLDQRVYQSYLSHSSKNGARLAAVAEEFGFPQANVERIVKKIESVLAQG